MLKSSKRDLKKDSFNNSILITARNHLPRYQAGEYPSRLFWSHRPHRLRPLQVSAPSAEPIPALCIVVDPDPDPELVRLGGSGSDLFEGKLIKFRE
jgi:hypothetical protein